MKTQEAIENLKYLISGDCTDSHMDFGEEIEMAINALEQQLTERPVADVEEVKHGWWLQNGMCSECLVTPETSHKSYCPNCGTKMDR